MGTFTTPLFAQQGEPHLSISANLLGILVTVLIAIFGACMAQLKYSYDMRSDLRVGIEKIEHLERTVNDHEERIREVERRKPHA
jgi:hypothetical protein